jgi:hypothetical protein
MFSNCRRIALQRSSGFVTVTVIIGLKVVADIILTTTPILALEILIW